MKFKVNKEIFSRYPNVVEIVVPVIGISNETNVSKEILDESKKVQKALYENFKDKDWMSDEKYKLWIDRFAKIAQEAGLIKGDEQYLPAHVSLTNRVVSGKGLPNINPIVNFYNMFSIKHGIPVGGEDFSRIFGNMELKYSSGEEKSLLIGNHEVSSAPKGEVVWVDDHSVTCELWAWRQSQRTAITKDTHDIYFIFDFDTSIFENGVEDCKSIISEFISDIEKYFGVKSEMHVLTSENPEVEIEYSVKQIPESYSPEQVEEDLQKLLLENKESEKGKKGITKRRAESIGLVDDTLLSMRLEKVINDAVRDDFEIISGHFTWCNDVKRGDFTSTLAMRLAKIIHKSPAELAESIVSELKASDDVKSVFSEIEIASNGFINFRLSTSFLINELETSRAQGQDYGKSKVGDNRVILVESPGWNPNKTPHVGHLLNLFLGKSLLRLFNSVGFDAQNDDIDNDKGLPVMQTIWAYREFGEGKTPESEGVKSDLFVHGFYSKGKQLYSESDSVKEAVKEVLRNWEAKDLETIRLWKLITSWAYEGQKQVFEIYGEKRDAYLWHESEVYEGGKEIVMSHLDNGVIEQLPDGAVIARIEQEYGPSDTIVVKSDGTGLYHTQDINLTLLKKKVFNPYKIVWVVAEEQISHFQRLFAILDALKIMDIENLYHFAYAFVVDKNGNKLSSRDGADLSADELYEALFQSALKIVEGRGSDESNSDKAEIARAVAIGAVKYAYLSRDPFKQIKFDIEEALSFNGKSGPYVMYAYTRAMSVINKVGSVEKFDTVSELELTDYDRELLLKSLEYPKVLIDAANNYYPGLIADYLFELAKSFNNFYENVNISKSDPEYKAFRVDLINQVAQVLKNGLNVLGIEVLEVM